VAEMVPPRPPADGRAGTPPGGTAGRSLVTAAVGAARCGRRPDDHGRPGSPGPGHAAPPVLLGEQVIGSAWMNSCLNIGCIAVSSRYPVSGMTSCRQLARHAGWPSVTPGRHRRCQLADTHDPGSGRAPPPA